MGFSQEIEIVIVIRRTSYTLKQQQDIATGQRILGNSKLDIKIAHEDCSYEPNLQAYIKTTLGKQPKYPIFLKTKLKAASHVGACVIGSVEDLPSWIESQEKLYLNNFSEVESQKNSTNEDSTTFTMEHEGISNEINVIDESEINDGADIQPNGSEIDKLIEVDMDELISDSSIENSDSFDFEEFGLSNEIINFQDVMKEYEEQRRKVEEENLKLKQELRDSNRKLQCNNAKTNQILQLFKALKKEFADYRKMAETKWDEKNSELLSCQQELEKTRTEKEDLMVKNTDIGEQLVNHAHSLQNISNFILSSYGIKY